MNNFFATPEGGWGDGSVHLTTVGIAIVIAVIALLLIVAAIVRHKNATHKSALTQNSSSTLLLRSRWPLCVR